MERTVLESVAVAWMNFWMRGNLNNFNSMHAADFVDYSSADRSHTREGFRSGIVALYEAFPDFNAEIQTLVIDDAADLVTIRWAASSQMLGPFLGRDPTKKQVHFTGIEIIKIRNSCVVERWGEWNAGDLLR